MTKNDNDVATTTTPSTIQPPQVIYALDFDGVLVDSAAETAQSGWRGCQILFPHAPWIVEHQHQNHHRQQSITNESRTEEPPLFLRTIIEKFVRIRPVLYVGW